MTTIFETDPLPPELTDELNQLRAALDERIPAKALDRNLLIATWNIRALGGFTDKWRSAAKDSPARDRFSLLCIAEILILKILGFLLPCNAVILFHLGRTTTQGDRDQEAG